jgi:alkylhydroperoxidase family enzyme
VQELIDSVGSGPTSASNIFLTLARHPGLFRKWLPFGGKLLAGGKLPARDRELAILRTAWRCGSDYEFGQHRTIGMHAGLSAEEVDRAAEPTADGWSAQDATLLRATDELVADHELAEATWTELAERYDTMQLIELAMLVGHYAMLAGVLNSAGVQREDGVAGFPG